MKKILAILLIVSFPMFVFSQTKIKHVHEVLWNNTYDKYDTSIFHITKIDTTVFKELLKSNSKIAIQFWQPWCNGEREIIPRVNELRTKLEQENYRFILLSDNPSDLDYYKISEGRIGLIVSYFNRCHIHFPTFIIGKGESHEMYYNLISRFIGKKIKSNYTIILFDEKGNFQKSFSHNFYKKHLK